MHRQQSSETESQNSLSVKEALLASR